MHYLRVGDFPPQPVCAPGAQGVSIHWLVDESHGAPNFALRRFVVEPGGRTPAHQHPWEHVVYILSGQAEVVLAAETVTVGADTALLVSPDELHQFRNAGQEPLVFLCLVPKGPATKR